MSDKTHDEKIHDTDEPKDGDGTYTGTTDSVPADDTNPGQTPGPPDDNPPPAPPTPPVGP